MIKAIIFDYDDMLVQTMASKWDALKATGKRFYNLDITDDHIRKFWGKPFREMLEGVLSHADTFENLEQNYLSLHGDFPMRAHANAPLVLAKLMETYEVGVLTASSRKLVVDDLTMTGFAVDKMIYIQASEDTDVHKPDPRVFDPMLRHLAAQHIERSRVLYVGDGVKDYEAARDAGLNFIGVTYGTTSRSDFKTAGARTIATLNELLSLDL